MAKAYAPAGEVEAPKMSIVMEFFTTKGNTRAMTLKAAAIAYKEKTGYDGKLRLLGRHQVLRDDVPVPSQCHAEGWQVYYMKGDLVDESGKPVAVVYTYVGMPEKCWCQDGSHPDLRDSVSS